MVKEKGRVCKEVTRGQNLVDKTKNKYVYLQKKGKKIRRKEIKPHDLNQHCLRVY